MSKVLASKTSDLLEQMLKRLGVVAPPLETWLLLVSASRTS